MSQNIINNEKQIIEPINEELVVIEEIISAEPVKKKFDFKKFFTSKITIIVVLILVILGLAYYFKGFFVAALVNGQPISHLELIKLLEAQSGKPALDSLIEEKLINQAAAQKGIIISNDEINAEFKKIEESLVKRGTSLDDLLKERNLTRAQAEQKIIVKKNLEKLLGDKINVSDEEVEKYIKDNDVNLPKGKEAESKANLKDNIKNSKFNSEARKFVDELKAKAKINYWVNFN